MSGGAYDYAYIRIDELADKISKTSVSIDIQQIGNTTPDLRREFVEHLRLVAKACRAIEWNDSGDGDPDEGKLIRQCLGIDHELQHDDLPTCEHGKYMGIDCDVCEKPRDKET